MTTLHKARYGAFMRRKSLSEWVEQAKQVHGDHLSFASATLAHVKSVSYLEGIQCNRCQNIYTVSAHEVVRGARCPQCAPKRRLTEEEILARARASASNSIDLESAIAVRRSSIWWLLRISCRSCDRIYEARLNVVERGGECFECKGSQPLGKVEFIRRSKLAHSASYDYSEVVYVSKSTPVAIRCAVHGPFEQTPELHLRGVGCKECKKEAAEQRKHDPKH